MDSMNENEIKTENEIGKDQTGKEEMPLDPSIKETAGEDPIIKETAGDQEPAGTETAGGQEPAGTETAAAKADLSESETGKKKKYKKKTMIAKMIILTLVLAALAVFVFVQRNNIWSAETVYYPIGSEEAESEYKDLEGSQTYSFKFKAEKNLLKETMLYFLNEDKGTCKGVIKVSLKDGNDVVADTEVKAALLANISATKIHLGGDSNSINENRIITEKDDDKYGGMTVEEGKTYTLEIKTENVSSEKRLGIAYKEGKIQAKMIYGGYNLNILLFFFAIIAAAFLIVIIPWEKSKIAFNKAALRIMFILTPFLCYFMIYKIAGTHMGEILRNLLTVRGALNLVIVTIIWLFVYVIVNRIRWASIITTFATAFFCLMNYALIQFRDFPLIASDFQEAGTGLQVAKSYSLDFNQYSIWCIVLAVVWICLNIRFESYKGLSWKHRLIPLLALVVLGGSFYYVIFKTDFVRTNKLIVSGFKPSSSYRKNGYALSFLITVKNAFIEKPKGYSENYAIDIEKDYPSDKKTGSAKVSEKTPNIIAIMNESFADMTVLGQLSTNQDAVPFLRSLDNDSHTVKGWMHSSVFGGSTANSEFEFLTGNSMINLPYRSVPFRSMIKEKTNSITGTLKDQGYGGIVAFHPGLADSYNRNNVYPLLGFDKVIAYEDLKKPEKIRDYVSDAYDYKVVEDEYEKYRKSGSKKPFFMFNVTIQNHAAYKLRTGRVDAGISITNADQQEEEAIQFLNLMKQSDDALRELLAYYQNVSEPTVIILFGDHQPRLGNSFYDALLGKEKSELSLSETELKYKVPYFIWSNYDIADLTSDEREDISANYLSAYAFEKIGIKMSGYDKYRMELSEDYPVVTANGFIDKDGKIHNPLEKDDEKELREYSYVQYHDLVDHGEGNESFFRLSD